MNPLSSFTESCIKNHAMDDELTTGDFVGTSSWGSTNVNATKPAGESNVHKIMKLIPGLCHVRKLPPESSLHCSNRRKSCIPENQCHDQGIDISLPSKEVVSSNVVCHKTWGAKVPRHKKKIPINPKVMMFSTNQPRFNIDISCLNVKVSGPLNIVVGEMMGSNIKKVVTLSGAGMSTSAGIPDFRSPNSGIYDKLKEYDLPYAQAIFERKYFDKNPKPLFRLLKEMLVEDYKPTVAHYFVKLLEEKGILLRHITQNVDGLERIAGVSQNKVVEAHGSVYGSRCLKCQTEYDLQWLRDRLVVQGKEIPQCQNPHCLGMVKPNIVLFGETLNPRFMASVKKDIPECDLLIIIGTSLVVEPFASTVKKVHRTCPRIIVNNIPIGEHLGIVYEGSSEFNRRKKKSTLRDVFIQGSCDEGVLYLAKLFTWEPDLEALIHRFEPELLHHRSSASNSKSGNTGATLAKKERPGTRNADETITRKHLGSVNDKNKHSKLSDLRNAPEKEAGTSVANRAKNVWKCITSHVLKPGP